MAPSPPVRCIAELKPTRASLARCAQPFPWKATLRRTSIRLLWPAMSGKLAGPAWMSEDGQQEGCIACGPRLCLTPNSWAMAWGQPKHDRARPAWHVGENKCASDWKGCAIRSVSCVAFRISKTRPASVGVRLFECDGNAKVCCRCRCLFRIRVSSRVCAKGCCRIRAALRIVQLSWRMRAQCATMLPCNLMRVCCGSASPLWDMSEAALMRARHSPTLLEHKHLPSATC